MRLARITYYATVGSLHDLLVHVIGICRFIAGAGFSDAERRRCSKKTKTFATDLYRRERYTRFAGLVHQFNADSTRGKHFGSVLKKALKRRLPTVCTGNHIVDCPVNMKGT